MIEFDHVDFAYGKKPVLRGLTLRVGVGERVALQGPSGCGKTTLLRLVMGLERPDAGTVTVRTRRFSPMFQEDRLLGFLTVAENCALFATEPGSVPKVLDALGLGDAADLMPSALSGGMARRVALARALCHDADLYLLDEPFNGLDSENAARAAGVIRQITRGRTLLVVTHHEDEARAVGCVAYRLGEGGLGV